MAGLHIISFDDRDNTLRYQGSWFHQGTWNASNIGQTGTLSSSNDLSASVTFDFPEPAVAFYYYGIRRSKGATYGICVDCDPNSQNFETIDAVNFTDDGTNPPVLLFSRQFPTPAVHEIILRNQPDPRFPNDNSQIDIDRFEIGVVDPNTPSHPTSPASTPTTTQMSSMSSTATITQMVSASSSATIPTVSASSAITSQMVSAPSTSATQMASMTSTTTQMASTSSTTTVSQVVSQGSPKAPAGKIVGGVLGGLGLLLVILTLWLWCWRRKNQGIKESDTLVTSGLSSTTLQSQAIPQGRMSKVQTSILRTVYTGGLRKNHQPSPSPGSPSERMSVATSSRRVIQREVDAGSFGGSGDVETLPPDYEQAVGGSRTPRTPDYSPHLERHGAKSGALR